MASKLGSLLVGAGFRRYASNTTWLMSERILRMFVGLFVGIWVARYLGPSQFGLFSYAQSFVFLFTAISTLGIDSIVVRELVKNKQCSDILIGSAFGLKLLGAFLVFPMLIFAVQFTGNDSYTNLLIIVIASATIFQSFNVIDFYFQSKVMSKYVAIANAISLAISSVIKIILILNEAHLIAFAIVVAFDSFVLALGLIYFYSKKSGKIFKWKFQWTTAKGLLTDSWPLILSGLVISVYMKIDQVMIMEMMNEAAVGQYAAAVRLSEAWYFIPMVISSSLFPAILNAKNISDSLYFDRLQYLYNLMVWTAILIAVPFYFYSDWVVNLLYGHQYNEAGAVLMIHIWAGVFVFLGVAFSKYLVAENLVLKSFYRTTFGVVSNVLLNLILIPKYGIVGAAVATLLGQFSANYLYDVFDRDMKKQLILKTRSLFPIYALKLGK